MLEKSLHDKSRIIQVLNPANNKFFSNGNIDENSDDNYIHRSYGKVNEYYKKDDSSSLLYSTKVFVLMQKVAKNFKWQYSQ